MIFSSRSSIGRFKRNPLKRAWNRLSRNQKQMVVVILFLTSIPLVHGVSIASKGVQLVYTSGFAEASEVFMPNSINDMKAEVMDTLKNCENPNSTNVPVVFDSNGIASIGTYQWQPHSFQHYWKKMTGEEISKKDAVTYALDEEKARTLTAWVIFETNAGSGKDWVVCTHRHGLDAKVEKIKQLQARL